MNDNVMQRALQRSAEYNIPLAEAVHQIVEMDNERMNDEYDDLPYDHLERDCDEEYEPDEHDQFRDDVEADADALASAGYGTDEDYGYFGGDDY